ncbi:MAG: enoyl-[acyl-carrier-protein] reductase FabK [Clostridiales bacterium]|nr:MAG: enoyl-[acyl-carrier-protein] reductase FabK [Clostridiales bacterium]
MAKNKFKDLIGIDYPIIQGGMAWISDAELAAAVSNAGGLGIIAAGNAPGQWVKEQIRKAKTLTDKPFGVNVMLLSPFVEEVAEVVWEEKVKVIVTGAGNPGKYIKKWRENDVKIIPVVPSVGLAKRMEGTGVDAIIAEGTEAGGHIGELTTMCLLPQVVDAVDIPVIAAGGIADGRGIAAAFMMGASGVQVGTRFLVAKECNVHDNYKKKILEAKDIDTLVTGRPTGHPVRVLKNKLARMYKKMDKEAVPAEKYEELGRGALHKAACLGDVSMGSIMSGQIAGLVCKEQTASEIIEEMFGELKVLLDNAKDFNI